MGWNVPYVLKHYGSYENQLCGLYSGLENILLEFPFNSRNQEEGTAELLNERSTSINLGNTGLYK